MGSLMGEGTFTITRGKESEGLGDGEAGSSQDVNAAMPHYMWFCSYHHESRCPLATSPLSQPAEMRWRRVVGTRVAFVLLGVPRAQAT